MKYDAISYAWGNPSITAQIVVNDREWPVTTNLDSGLRYLRGANEEKVFWIDAICINQTDLSERGIQVALMKEIYSKAQCVRVWLGEAADASDRACDILEILLRTPSDDPGVQELGRALQPVDIMALVKFFDRSWWQRVWVIQEFGLASDSTIHCGTKTLLMGRGYDGLWLKTFRAINATIKLHGWEAVDYNDEFIAFERARLSPLRAFENVQALVNMKKAKASGAIKPQYIAHLLALVGQFQASDSRDMIYGLLGLMPRSEDLSPDYRRTVGQVYSDATIYATQRMGDLAMFTLAELWRSKNSDLPSWTPDWRLSDAETVAAYRYSRVTEVSLLSDFDACDSFALSLERVDDETLKVEGYFFDSVKDESSHRPRPPDAAAEDDSDETLQVLREACNVDSRRKRSSRYPSGGRREDAYVQCLAYARDLKVYGALWTHFGLEERRDQKWWRRWIRIHEDHSPSSMNKSDGQIRFGGEERAVVNTTRGYIGIGPTEVQPGDQIYILLGATIPHVLRPVASSKRPNTFALVGGCYVQGVMHGEAVAESGPKTTILQALKGVIRRSIFGGHPPDKNLPLENLEDVFIV